MKNCMGCKYAEWDKTKSGRLHPNGEGKCLFEFKIPTLPACKYFVGCGPTVCGGFNSRAHAGRDMVKGIVSPAEKFQLTRPRGARRVQAEKDAELEVSTHAPTRGATSSIMTYSLARWEQDALDNGPCADPGPDPIFWRDKAGNVRDFETGRILKPEVADGLRWKKIRDFRKKDFSLLEVAYEI